MSVERIRELQQRVRRMEGVGVAPELSLLPAFAEVLSVRAGTVCSLDSPGLALALAAGASQAGAWVGFAGLPEVGWEAAAEIGIDLDRTVSVPFPGEHFLSVTAAMVEVIGVVIARPPGPVGEAQAGRVAARLRQRGAVLIVDGSWPRAAIRLKTMGSAWTGLGAGHGHLRSRRLRLQIATLSGVPRLVELDLQPGTLTAGPNISTIEPNSGMELSVDSDQTFAPAAAMVG